MKKYANVIIVSAGILEIAHRYREMFAMISLLDKNYRRKKLNLGQSMEMQQHLGYEITVDLSE